MTWRFRVHTVTTLLLAAFGGFSLAVGGLGWITNRAHAMGILGAGVFLQVVARVLEEDRVRLEAKWGKEEASKRLFFAQENDPERGDQYRRRQVLMPSAILVAAWILFELFAVPAHPGDKAEGFSRDSATVEIPGSTPEAAQAETLVRDVTTVDCGSWLEAVPPLVGFGSGEAAIPGSVASALADLVKRLGENRYLSAHVGAVEVVGHTDSAGGSKYNVELGLARAHAVRAELARLGVPLRLVEVASHGEEHALKQEARESARSEERRVEIRVCAHLLPESPTDDGETSSSLGRDPKVPSLSSDLP